MNNPQQLLGVFFCCRYKVCFSGLGFSQPTIHNYYPSEIRPKLFPNFSDFNRMENQKSPKNQAFRVVKFC